MTDNPHLTPADVAERKRALRETITYLADSPEHASDVAEMRQELRCIATLEDAWRQLSERRGLKVAASDEPLYYIQDARNCVGNSVLWWGPKRNGYTTRIDEAGKYPASEARGLRETDVFWRVEDVDQVVSLHVDIQRLRLFSPLDKAKAKAS